MLSPTNYCKNFSFKFKMKKNIKPKKILDHPVSSKLRKNCNHSKPSKVKQFYLKEELIPPGLY